MTTVREMTALIKADNVQAELAAGMSPRMGAAIQYVAHCAVSHIAANPGIATCTWPSVFSCLKRCCELGILPNGDEAYLIPFKDKKKGETVCTLIPGYRGLVKTLKACGVVVSITGECVYEHDAFSFGMGDDEHLRHSWPMTGDRGKPIGAWARAELPGGGRQFVVLTLDEIEGVRRQAKSPNSPAWAKHWPRMAVKTAVRRLVRLIPPTSQEQAAAVADIMTADNAEFDDHGSGTIDADHAAPSSGSKADELADVLGGTTPTVDEWDDTPEDAPTTTDTPPERPAPPSSPPSDDAPTTTDTPTQSTFDRLKLSIAAAMSITAVNTLSSQAEEAAHADAIDDDELAKLRGLASDRADEIRAARGERSNG